MSEFRDITDILTDERLIGGVLAGQGNEHPAGDFDEPLPPNPELLTEMVRWEIRNKSNVNEIYYYRDLQQFAREVTGAVVEAHGIDTIASAQGYPRSEEHSFDVAPKDGTTGDVKDYEARIIKTSSTLDETLPPSSRRDMNVTNLHNYVEPTGQ